MPSRRVVFTDCEIAAGGAPAIALPPETPMEKLKLWCERNVFEVPLTSDAAAQVLLARVRAEARALGAMCSPELVEVPEGPRTVLTLVLNPWPTQPLLWEGEGA